MSWNNDSDDYAVCRVMIFVAVSAIILFSNGCAQQQQAVDLYVDAVMLTELEENDQAIEKLNSAVKLNKRFSLAYSLLGEIYLDMAEYHKSAEASRTAARLNPWSFKDYFNLGRSYQFMERFSLAVKAYTRACELDPDHLQAHFNATKCYFEIEDYNNALIYGRHAAMIAPEISEIQKLLGDVYRYQEDYDRAVASYKRALENDSENSDIMVSLAVAYLKNHRNEAAKELLTTAINIQPDNNDAHKYLGYYYLLLRSKAVESYKRLLDENGDQQTIDSLRTGAARALDKAVESYRTAIAIDEHDWDAHRQLGVAYILQGTAEDRTVDDRLRARAVEQWQRSLEIRPDQTNRQGLLKLINYYSN